MVAFMLGLKEVGMAGVVLNSIHESQVAWLLCIDPEASKHVSNDPETRDRWIEQYGPSKVFSLGVIGSVSEPVAWRYCVKGCDEWYYHEGNVFDVPEPDSYEYEALYAGGAPQSSAADGSHGKYQALIDAARRALQNAKSDLIPRNKFPLSHNRPMHENARTMHSLSALESALEDLGVGECEQNTYQPTFLCTSSANFIPFDICDPSNVYFPCPACGSIQNMGLVTVKSKLAVQCGDCGHRGPEIKEPPAGDWEGWTVTPQQRDQQAFDGWNEASRQHYAAAGGVKTSEDPK
jgi:predicted RNA-binding Zn-ribbon protein involved in translation (DUF1610 family)